MDIHMVLHFVFQTPKCVSCPAGYECINVTQPPVPCESGSYSIEGNSSCSVCSPGEACPNPTTLPINCSLGTYSTSVSNHSSL